jgi:hypothetical protein
MKAHRIVPALGTVVLVSSHLWADSWATPTPRVFGSQWGSRASKVLKPTFSGPSEGVLFRLASHHASEEPLLIQFDSRGLLATVPMLGPLARTSQRGVPDARHRCRCPYESRGQRF